MIHSRPMGPRLSAVTRRHARAALALPVAALVLTGLAGCGNPGDLKGAGPTSTAVGPTRLWPEVPPASALAVDRAETETETITGVTAPGDDIREVDPVEVFRAEEYTGTTPPSWETDEQAEDCREQGVRGRSCPVLRPYYRDLTGDGKDEMVLGIRLPEGQLAVRVYTFVQHELVRIMASLDSALGVEIAGNDVIIRSTSNLAGYEYRTVWSWDRRQRAMLAERDEILRVGTSASPVPEETPPEIPVASPSAGAR